MAIANVQLGTSATAILTAASETAILSLVFCNTTASDRTITVYAYASGGSAGDLSTIIKDLTIPSKDTFIWTGDEKLILDTSGVISGLSDAATSISVAVNYKVL